MADLTDPVALLLQRPPGSCLFGRIQLVPNGPWEVAWYLREESARIKVLGQPDVEFRAGAIEQHFQGQTVVLMPILVRIGPEVQENLWESWMNAWADDGHGLLELTTLAEQERLTLHFYGDRPSRLASTGALAPERSLVISNQLKGFAAQARRLIVGGDPWSMLTFDRARAQLEARYPTVMALWQSLQGPGGQA